MKKAGWIFLLGCVLAVGLAAQNAPFLLQGVTQSFVHGCPGVDTDIVLYKIDGAGNKQWRKNFGGTNPDYSFDCLQTPDGGFLIYGYSLSFVHGTPGIDRDGLVYRLDADGKKLWRRNIGGPRADTFNYAAETTDGGYVFFGETQSTVHGPYGLDSDILVVKMDASGTTLWQKNLGGTYPELSQFGIGCANGDILVLGHTSSYVHGTPGVDTDFLVYRLDPAGNKLWRKNFGGAYMDQPIYLFEDSVGHIFASGMSQSFVTGTPGSDLDILVYKLDANGNKQWRKHYGGSYLDSGYAMLGDSGAIYIRANTLSFVHGVPGADTDFLDYRIDGTGAKQWRKNLGGTYPEGLGYVYECEGAYLVTGISGSFVHGAPGSDRDLVIYRLDAGLNKQWRRNYGGTYTERGGQLILLDDGDLLLAGETQSYVGGVPGSDWDMLIYRLDPRGLKRWRKHFGGFYSEDFYRVHMIE